MSTVTLWRTDDRCLACGTGLNVTEDGAPPVTQKCPLCGWIGTWGGAADG